jgi:predicted transcriptional regulator
MTKKIKDANTYKLDAITAERVREIGEYLEYSDTEVLELLVSQYFKMQTIEHKDEKGLQAIEYVPFFETKKSYQEYKEQYQEEFGFAYRPKMMTRGE